MIEFLRVASCLAFILILTVVGSMSVVAQESACSCETIEERVELADVVFVGTSRDINTTVTGRAGQESLWNFDVVEMINGPDGDVLAVSGGGELSNCSVEFEQGRTYGIAAFWVGGHLAAGLCGVAAPAEVGGTSLAGSNAPWLALGVGGVLIVVMVALRRFRAGPEQHPL